MNGINLSQKQQKDKKRYYNNRVNKKIKSQYLQMSDNDSQSVYDEYEDDKPNDLFKYDTSLVRSVENINNWKNHIQLPVLQYLAKQVNVVSRSYQLFTCGNQIRCLAFYRRLDKAFEQLISKYQNAYSRVKQQNFDILSSIRNLDSELLLIVKYLQKVEANSVGNVYDQVFQQDLQPIYEKLRKSVDYCVDLNTLWQALLTPRMFRENYKQRLYKVNYGAPIIYYEKELWYLSERIQRAQINNFIMLPKNITELLQSISLILGNKQLKQNLKTKIVSLLKGYHYASMNKNIKQEFILSSLQMYNGEQVSELWDYEKYENLCIETLKKSFTDQQYLDCALYMQPESIHFQRRKRTVQFAQIYYALIEKIIHIRKQSTMQESSKKIQTLVEIPENFVKQIMSHQNILLIGHLFVNFLLSNKNSFSLNIPDLHKYLFGILERLKQIYLSFGTLQWMTSPEILYALTNRFFSKFSEDIKSQIMLLLPTMVKHLGEDKLPYKPNILVPQNKQSGSLKLEMTQVPRAEYLIAIFNYIKDAEYKDQDLYLDLPQVTPTNFQTAVMFVRSLELKLRHHQPTQDQKKIWTLIIEQSTKHYKIKVDLKWYKAKNKLDDQQRIGEFSIHKQIKEKWAFDLIQEVLNVRDKQKEQEIINERNLSEVSIETEIVNYFKFAVGLKMQSSTWRNYIHEQDLFSLLQKMKGLLEINYGDIVNLKNDEKITLNQLHLCLTLYNTKYTVAKGSQIYDLIVTKIILPWFQSGDKAGCERFKVSFPQFFQSFIIEEYYLMIGDELITNMERLEEDKQNLQQKLLFYGLLLNRESVITNKLQNNVELLQKLFSVMHQNMSPKTLRNIMLIVIKFMGFLPELENQYISIGFIIDFITQKQAIQKFFEVISDSSEKDIICLELIKKLPENISNFSEEQICKIVKYFMESSQKKFNVFFDAFDKIPENKNTLTILALKALAAEKIEKEWQPLSFAEVQDKIQQTKYFKYWKLLEEYVEKHIIQRKKQEEELNLMKLINIFQENSFSKLKEDYRKIIQAQIIRKKRSSKKKNSLEKKNSSSMSESEKEKQQQKDKQKDKQKEKQKAKQVTQNDKFKQARIWRKVVRNFGSFQDIIMFGQDPLELAGPNDEEIYQKCIKIIKQKNIQQKYLKKVIKKLPILQKCAQDVVKQVIKQQKQGNKYVQPELLCKLIMINSRYRSEVVQQFILSHIARVPIPIKIYQDYLALDIKKKLQSFPSGIVHKVLFDEKVGSQNMKKIDQIFDELIYLPIKKFENIYLKFQNKIEENEGGENQQWQTQSQGEQKQSQTKEQKKEKKKVSKRQANIDEIENENLQSNNEPAQIEKLQELYAQEHEQIEGESDQGSGQSLDDEDEELNDDVETQTKIVQMFYTQNQSNLPKYKSFIGLRQQINVFFEDNYLDYEQLQKKAQSDPEIEKKLFRIVDILENQFNQKEVVVQIIDKIPKNLYNLLKKYGLTLGRNEQKIEEYRKQQTKMPRFIKDYMSDRDQNSNEGEQQLFDDELEVENDDSLSEETQSIDDLQGEHLFIINEQGQIQSIQNNEWLKEQLGQLDQQQENQMEQLKVAQKLEQQADDTLSLPQLKQINSKIESQLTGKQLNQEQMTKILQMSIIKLFSFHSYQLRQKPVLSYYKQLIKSKHGKIFIDTLFTILRMDEMYSEQQKFNLAKKLSGAELSLSKGLNNILQIILENQSAETDGEFSKYINKIVTEEVGALLPVGDEVMIKSDIPIQDNYLTLLVFYSRYNQKSAHEKTKNLLTKLCDKQYKLTKAKASILTKQIYKNNNSSSIWNSIQERFGVKIDSNTKFSSCLTVYGQRLREDIEKCYSNLLEIVNIPIVFKNQEQKHDAKQLIKQQEKKVEQNLRKNFKRIKHYYYWNKRNILNVLQNQQQSQKKPFHLLKNNQLIKLTQLMIFYCHFIKQKFFQKIDVNAMKNLLVLPKSIIEVSFMFLWKLEVKIDKWEPLNKVKQYFKSFKLYQHKFQKLQQVCNLVLQFLQMPEFSNSKFKQVIIPYFINNPSHALQIPLIFKLPDIPEEHNGQKVYLTRECSFDMAFYQLVSKSFTVEFHYEEGSDHGGMVRELMMGWKGIGIGEQHIFIGKLLAISFRKSIPYGGLFDVAMAVAITQWKVTIQFFQQVDPEIAQSLKYIRDNEDTQDLQLKFEVSKEVNGILKHYPLVPNGSQIAVTNQNKNQYIDLFLKNYFSAGREWQMAQLCTGFFSIVNKKYAAIFTPLQMIQKIQGEQISDYMKLKNKTKYEQGYTETSQMIKWFWEIVAEFNQYEMNRFLQFITGAPKVSIYNHNFSFIIEKPYGQDQNRLPVAHTCFNTVELPEYKTKEILQKKLTQAIFQGNDTFGIM